jgi:TetR/AcrR family transcriptional regulator of autoinduction and epiphytic fitness
VTSSERVGLPARVDGRSLRAERTRQAIVAALHELLAEGRLKVSARQTAERAGVSLRALWSNFGDLEGLYAASNARVQELLDAEYRPIPPELPLRARVEAFCRQRARMLELITPFARAAHLTQPYSPQLQRNRSVQIGHVRDEISALFGAELDRAGSPRCWCGLGPPGWASHEPAGVSRPGRPGCPLGTAVESTRTGVRR